MRRPFLLAWLASLVAVSCAAPAPTSRPSAEGALAHAGGAPAAPKRIVVAIQGSPPGAYPKLDANNSERGSAELGLMLHASLTVTDLTGDLRPQLAEAVPSPENGLWTILPDGRMETRWRIREGVDWHDGTPLTTADLLFTVAVARDREVPVFRERPLGFVEAVEALDARTVLVRWRQTYIQADRLFSDRSLMPLPKHLLEAAFAEDKPSFVQLPFWGTDFVGLGAYRVKEWVRSSHVIVQANDRFVLGRPRIDEIEVRTIPDANSIVANILAGTVDFTPGRALTLDQIVQIRDRMPSLQIQTPLTSLMVINPQMLNPTPAVVANLEFRRALLHAIDRQELADTIDYGLVPVAYGFIFPTLREAHETESAIVRYDHNPGRTAQLVESLGYAKGSDGFFREAAGQVLRLEIRATQGEANPKTMFAVADFLQRVGIAIDQVIIPLQLVSDQQYRATFPGLIVNGGPAPADDLESSHSDQARLPETNWTGSNRSRYINPELDALIDRFRTTIPFGPRMEVARQITRHVTENLPILPLFFDTWPSVSAERLMNANASANNGRATWNVHEWDIR